MTSCAACPIGKACEGACLFEPAHLRAGERIHAEGEPAGTVWFIKSGTVALGGGRVRRAGSLLGLELLAGGRYRDTARAVTDVTLCALPRARFDAWLGPPARAVLEIALRDATAPDGGATRSVARWLLGASDVLGPPLSRRVVAAMLGLAPAALARALAELGRRGAIQITSRTIAIRDRSRLRASAGDE